MEYTERLATEISAKDIRSISKDEIIAFNRKKWVGVEKKYGYIYDEALEYVGWCNFDQSTPENILIEFLNLYINSIDKGDNSLCIDRLKKSIIETLGAVKTLRTDADQKEFLCKLDGFFNNGI